MKNLLGHSALLLALKIASSVLALVFHYVLAKQLDVAEFGLFSLAASCLLFSSAFAKQGLEPCIVRLAAQCSVINNDSLQQHRFSISGLYLFVLIYSGLMALVIAAGLYILADFIADAVFTKPALSELLPLTAALTLINTWLAMNSSLLKGRGHAVISMLFTGTVTFILVLMLFYVNPPVSAILAIEQLTMAAAMACITSFIVTCLKVKPFAGPKQFKPKLMLSSNAWLFVVAMAALVTQQLSVLVLGRYAPLEQVGVFSIAMKISLLLSYPLIAMNAYTAQQYAKYAAQGAYDALKSLAKNSNKILLIVGSIGAAIVFIFAELIAGFFGQAYLPAAEIIRILIIGQWVNLATGSVVSILLMNGYERLHSRNIFIIMLINVAALLILVPTYGVIAAAWVTTIIMASKNILSWYYVHTLIFSKAVKKV